MRKKITVEKKILKRLDDLYNVNHSFMVQLLEMERKMFVKPLRYLRFDACIPPVNICKEVASMLIGMQTYTGFIGKLADYYGCSTMEILINKEMCKPKYLAVYYPLMKRAYTNKDTVSQETVLHEWFHHMVNEKVVYIGDENKEEEFAGKYSEIFMGRANS